VHDLEKFEEAVVGRELQMINIKRELQDTKRELERLKQNGRDKIFLPTDDDGE
jgi:hypothetical protein